MPTGVEHAHRMDRVFGVMCRGRMMSDVRWQCSDNKWPHGADLRRPAMWRFTGIVLQCTYGFTMRYIFASLTSALWLLVVSGQMTDPNQPVPEWHQCTSVSTRHQHRPDVLLCVRWREGGLIYQCPTQPPSVTDRELLFEGMDWPDSLRRRHGLRSAQRM